MTTALVTGGGTGIGRACSLALHRAGYAVAISYRRSSGDAEATVAEIEADGGRAIAVAADVTDDAAVTAMVADVRARLGPVAVLVNNAGATIPLPLDDLDGATDDVWQQMLAVNLMAPWYCARAAADDLRAAEDGVVVNIGSIAGLTGSGSSLPYAVSKSALHGLTRSLARALAPVRVNEVAPGLVLTRWWAGNEERGRELASKALLDRETTPDDVARAVLGLVESRAMTGQTVVVDGGQTV
ncbi:3-oxoacyl-[acyl-carrier protein] reductase [Actinomycetospora succinea]|uniref:3-oxoacyl-[acyl-carrier protein] reductase n=1 Tax=Actinomycetospora succinea TaxID=663603 RepID=A0A4R6UPB5_9PSEU|nr:SDR family oxidoreductase [Actinomycetospora succinea]TDQ47065.1 3-oxoacyl-[acyl-carrier protein] reductase [Actinomycetospora succinea]